MLTAIMQSIAALFSVVTVTWAARDGWIRWLAHRERAREVDAGLKAAHDHFDGELTATRKHFDQLFAKLEKQNNALAAEMVAAKQIVVELKDKDTARGMVKPATRIVGHRPPG